MKTLRVNAGNGYDILIERGILGRCGRIIQNAVPAKKAAIISDSHVAPLYLETVENSINKAGIETVSYIFEAGESSKTTENLIRIVEFLAESGLTRKDCVVALGGGVCGDMAGFAAAVYLRGIRYVQIPTTLLAQVDSSVGGKTAVDLPQGKNLCGAFWQPAAVIIDPNVLDTLPGHFFSDGMGEVIKYGCIKSASLFEKLQNGNARDRIDEVIFECCDIKRGVVERDEKEFGERALLNFGHTCGHAIEKLCDFSGISHGEAVGIGMVMISRAGENAGITENGTADKIAGLLKKYGLKTKTDLSVADIVHNMAFDKKRTSDGINLIMLSKIGESFIRHSSQDEVNALFGIK